MDALAFIRVRELDVAVRIYNPTAPRTLVAWHGLARHGGDFEALARSLGSEWRVLAPDTPGRGLSSWSLFPAHDYLYRQYIEVAIAILDHFELSKVAWLGTSMGGLLGMLLAADDQHAGRIERLILNDVGPALSQQGLIKLSSYFGITHHFNSFAALQAELESHYASFGIENDKEWLTLALNSARRLPDGSWTYHFDPRIGEQFIHDTPRDMWAIWKQIQCPLLTLRGEESALLEAETLDQMSAANPWMRRATFAGCGHAPMLNTPEQTRVVEQFLSSPRARLLTPGHSQALRLGLFRQWLSRQWRQLTAQR